MPRGLNPYDEAGLQGRLWTPANLGGNLIGWWDASRARTIIISTGVSQWSDISGYNNHFIQATGGSQPTYTTFANRPCVQGDGSNDFMTSSNNVPQNFAIFAVHGYPNNSASPPFLWSVANLDAVGELHLSTNGSIRAINRDAGPYSDTPTGTPESFYDDCVVGGAYGASGNNVLRAHLNGRDAQSTPTRANTNIGVLNIFRRDSNAFYGLSRFTEIVAFTNWTLPDIWKVEGYLAYRWGGLPLSRLIANHPFKNRPPLIGD